MPQQTKSWKTQTLNIFGPAPSTKWTDTFRWTAVGVGPGNGTFGQKSAGSQGSQPIIFTFFKNSLTNTPNNIFITCPASSVFLQINKTHANTISASYANTDKRLISGNYQYVYPKPDPNIENQNISSYNSLSVAAGSFTCLSVGGTVWT